MSVDLDIILGNSTASWWNISWNYRLPVEINNTNVTRKDKLIDVEINFSEILSDDMMEEGIEFDPDSIRVIEWSNNGSIEIASQFDNATNYNATHNAVGTVSWIMNDTTNQNTTRNYYVYFDTMNNPKDAANYSKPDYTISGSDHAINYDGEGMSASNVELSYMGESFIVQLNKGNLLQNFDFVNYAGAGGIRNITVNNQLITNPNSVIAPIAIRNNDYLEVNDTVNIETGPVKTTIRLPANITNIDNSEAGLNYTIWFTGTEIILTADLYAYFGSEETDPSVRYMNQWFAYLLNNYTNWEDYIYKAESETLNRTHQYDNKAPVGSNTIYSSSWYTEHDGMGSINVYAETFQKDSVNQSKAGIIFDDGYDG